MAEDPFQLNLDEKAHGKEVIVGARCKGEEPAYWNHGDRPLIVETPKYGHKVFTGQTHMPSPTKVIFFNNVNLFNNAKHAYDMFKFELDPQLLEEVVFQEVRRREQIGDQTVFRDYRDRVDALYDLPEDDDRETAFRDVHAEFFDRLGLEQMIRNCLNEFPLLYQKLDRIDFMKALTRKEEGAELFVRSDDAEGDRQHRVAMFRLRAEVFLDAEHFSTLTRSELYHVSDMVDPAFGYEPDLGDSVDGEDIAQKNLVRDRYSILWSLYIDRRLVDTGRAPATILQQGRSLLDEAFAGFGDEHVNAVFKTVSNAKSLSHSDLLALARSGSPESVASDARRISASPDGPRMDLGPVGSDMEPDCSSRELPAPDKPLLRG